MKKRDLKLEKTLFITGWCVLALAFVVVTIYYLFFGSKGITLVVCPFHAATGLYCPGCGGTRAVLALIHGRVIQSLICHPFVLYALVVLLWYLISHTIGIIVTRVKNSQVAGLKIAMPYKNIWLWIGLGVAVLNFVVKLVLQLVWHIDVIKWAEVLRF